MKNIIKKISVFIKRDYLIISLVSFILILVSSDYILNIISINTNNILFVIIKSTLVSIALVFTAYYMNIKNITIIKQTINKKNKLEQKHKKILQKIKYDYFFYKHEKDNCFLEISDSIQTIFGYNKDEFISSLKQHNIKELTNNVFERVAPFAKEGIIVPSYEVDIYARNGDKLKFEIFETPIVDNKGNIEAVEVVAHNLHIDATSILSEEKSSYKKIFETLNFAILIIKGDKFIDSNKKALEIFKCSIEDITMASPFSSRFSPQFQPDGISSEEKAKKYLEQALKKGQIEFEWVHLRNLTEEFIAIIDLTTFTYNDEKYLLVTIKENNNNSIVKENNKFNKILTSKVNINL